MLHVISTAAMLAIFVGLWIRTRNRRMHKRLMIGAFITDLLLAAYIELTTQAVEQVAREMSPLMLFHVIVSVGFIVLYFVMFALGRRLDAGREEARSAHRNIGMLFLLLRLANYVTSYFV